MLAYQSKAANTVDNNINTKCFWTSENVSEKLVISFNEVILDEQELNEFSGFDFVVLESTQNIQSIKYNAYYSTVFETSFFKFSLHFSFIDLPPPSLS